jgi:RNA polymerase sigma factor for flagellar operon FliA
MQTFHALETDAQNYQFAAAIAATTARKLAWGLDRDDLRSAAWVGFLQAAARFQEGSGAALTTFAHQRIRGAVLDFARAERRHAGPESHRRVTARDEDERPAVTRVPADDRSPEAECLWHEARLAVRAALRSLPARLRLLIELRYYEELPLERIGERLGVSKSRASRLHQQALDLLRQELAGRVALAA